MQRRRLTTLIVIMLSLINIAMNQPINFDYKQHGKDWTGDCVDEASNKQSPIILPRGQIKSTKQSYLFSDFRQTAAKGTIYNTTLLIELQDSDDKFGEVYTRTNDGGDFSYRAFQIRFRTRSEHRIKDQNGFADLQVQITTNQLFDTQSNTKLNVGLLFKVSDNQSDADPFLAEVIKNSKENQTFELKVNLDHLLSRQLIYNFWFYVGSVTYPNCRNGGINWIVLDNLFKMSQTQLNFFKQYYYSKQKNMDGNWRDVQLDADNQISYASVLPSTSQL